MQVFDANEQRIGTVLSTREDAFVLGQEVGLEQWVVVPLVAVAGVVEQLVLLTLTAGELELYCYPLKEEERTGEERWMPGWEGERTRP